jgi:hypothetical protein
MYPLDTRALDDAQTKTPTISSRLSRKGPVWTMRTAIRVVVFAVVMVGLIAYPVYVYLDAAVSGGIKRRGDVIVVDLKAMSDFDINQFAGTDENIPRKFRDLDGKRVECTGEMWAPYSAGGRLDRFELCYSIAKCCFGGPPRVQCFVHVTVPQGRDVQYHQGLVTVTGVLHVGVTRSHGKIQSVYRMEIQAVKPG